MLNIFRTQILSLCNSNPVYNFLECQYKYDISGILFKSEIITLPLLNFLTKITERKTQFKCYAGLFPSTDISNCLSFSIQVPFWLRGTIFQSKHPFFQFSFLELFRTTYHCLVTRNTFIFQTGNKLLEPLHFNKIIFYTFFQSDTTYQSKYLFL